MTRTSIDIDDVALAEAAAFYGTKTKKDTVNAALRDVAVRLKRMEAVEAWARMGAAGDFDALLVKENYRP
ncbi:type II toxin-antitoxin system VapB family antitoxin [Winogradskya consettensis]|nr:type II toxin-antitoxin system VapB family antitoxin [Actinoplanes consettensis]